MRRICNDTGTTCIDIPSDIFDRMIAALRDTGYAEIDYFEAVPIRVTGTRVEDYATFTKYHFFEIDVVQVRWADVA